ncbi:hypothetical protein PL11201_410051 [Planktothrix sp. PCC 11201]|nr:hypothetical protein PL11201_410051 [Planktothrix sp. PCC 11201]
MGCKWVSIPERDYKAFQQLPVTSPGQWPVSIPERDYKAFQLRNEEKGSKIASRFQSLKGIIRHFNLNQ